MRWLTPLLLFSFGFILSAEEVVRTWTDLQGRKVDAQFMDRVGDSIRIKNAAGQVFTVPLSRFVEADRKYVEKVANKKINSQFGLPLPFEKRQRRGNHNFDQR